MNIPFSPPDITDVEIEEVIAALKSGWITTGPKTKEFERQITEYCGSAKTVCLSAATTALEMTLRVLGIGKGDEVIVPAYTYTASCSVICHVGATPVMVDSQKDKEEMDYTLLSEAISDKTKVIIPVDIAGILCDYDKIFEIIESKKDMFQANNELQEAFNRIIVLADCAHGFGAVQNGKTAGNLADFTCFSFHAVKNLTTGEGGIVVTKDSNLYNNARYYKNMCFPVDGPRNYEHNNVGYNYRMSNIHAAIGLAQVEKADEYRDLRIKNNKSKLCINEKCKYYLTLVR